MAIPQVPWRFLFLPLIKSTCAVHVTTHNYHEWSWNQKFSKYRNIEYQSNDNWRVTIRTTNACNEILYNPFFAKLILLAHSYADTWPHLPLKFYQHRTWFSMLNQYSKLLVCAKTTQALWIGIIFQHVQPETSNKHKTNGLSNVSMLRGF